MRLNSFISAQGEARTAIYSILIGAVLNIILNPIFIFGFDMGVRGAALATVISQTVSCLWILRFLTKKETSLRIIPRKMKPDFHIIGKISALGISPFIMASTESLIFIVLSKELSIYGDDLYVGSMTILQSVMQMIFIPMHGFTGGVAPILSYNYGAGQTDRVRETFRKTLIAGVSYGFCISLLAMLFPRVFAAFFTPDKAMIELVGRVLPVFICGMLIFGIQSVCQTTFMALGQAKQSLIIALLRKVVLLAPLAVILPALTDNVMTIYWAEPISDLISVTVCIIIFSIFVHKDGFNSKKMPRHNLIQRFNMPV